MQENSAEYAAFGDPPNVPAASSATAAARSLEGCVQLECCDDVIIDSTKHSLKLPSRRLLQAGEGDAAFPMCCYCTGDEQATDVAAGIERLLGRQVTPCGNLEGDAVPPVDAGRVGGGPRDSTAFGLVDGDIGGGGTSSRTWGEWAGCGSRYVLESLVWVILRLVFVGFLWLLLKPWSTLEDEEGGGQYHWYIDLYRWR